LADSELEDEPFAGSAASPRCTLTISGAARSNRHLNGTRAQRACQVYLARSAQHFARQAR
jgi:hypothetical protein